MASTLRERRNPVLAQDRAEDLLDNWRKYGYGMFPQQRAIYRGIAERLGQVHWVLEAGCGNGQGAHILCRHCGPRAVWATDKIEANIVFARELYGADGLLTFRAWDVETPWDGPNFPVVVAVEVVEHVAKPVAALRHLLAAATEEVWLSTPNGNGKPRPPENPHHVCEYTPLEMTQMLHNVGAGSIEILSWKYFERQDVNTTIDPLVYRVRK